MMFFYKLLFQILSIPFAHRENSSLASGSFETNAFQGDLRENLRAPDLDEQSSDEEIYDLSTFG